MTKWMANNYFFVIRSIHSTLSLARSHSILLVRFYRESRIFRFSDKKVVVCYPLRHNLETSDYACYQTLCLNRYIQTKCSNAAPRRFCENSCFRNLGKLLENIRGEVKF